MRIVIKAILIIATIWIGVVIVSIMRISGMGTLPMFIVVIGMSAGVKAIWSYKPSTINDISLKKDD